MVLRIVSHKVFSHLPRDLEHFAVCTSIPLNRPTTFRPSQILRIAVEVPSFILRIALSATQFASDR